MVRLLLLLALVAGAKPESKIVTRTLQKAFGPIVEQHAKVMIAQLWEDIACGKGGEAWWCESVHKRVDEAKDEEDAMLRALAPYPYTKCEILWVSSASNWRKAKEILENLDAGFGARMRLRNRAQDVAKAADKDQSEFDKQRCRAQ
jgi:hypothetical protein